MINVYDELNFLNRGPEGFEEEEISRSRDLLINLLPKNDAPLLKKRVPRLTSDSKSVQGLKEIYNIFQEYGKCDIIPTFAATKLDKMPQISYESPDATAMLIAFKKLETEVKLITKSLDSSKVSTEGIVNHILHMEHRISDLESPELFKLRYGNVDSGLPLSCTDCGNGSSKLTNISSDKEDSKINEASSIDANIEATVPIADFNKNDSENRPPVLESSKPRSRTHSGSDQTIPLSDTACDFDNVINKVASTIDVNIEVSENTEDQKKVNSDNKKGKEVVFMNDKAHVALNKNAEAYGKSEVHFTVWQIISLLLAMIIAPITLCLNLYSGIVGGFVMIDHLVLSLYML